MTQQPEHDNQRIEAGTLMYLDENGTWQPCEIPDNKRTLGIALTGGTNPLVVQKAIVRDVQAPDEPCYKK